MKRKNSAILFLLIAVMLGVAAAFLSVQTVRSFNETGKAVMAVKDLPPYALLKPEDVKLVDMPAASVPLDAVQSLKEVNGRYLASPVLAGEVLRKGRLAEVRGDRGLMAAKLSALSRPDLRAFALPWDAQSAVGGKIKDGDRIDIVASVKIDGGSAGSVGVGKIVARNVEVLEVVKGSEGDRGSLIVALTPPQIEDIAFALTSGQLRFALNPYNTDEGAAATQGVTGKAWLEKYGFIGEPVKSEVPGK